MGKLTRQLEMEAVLTPEKMPMVLQLAGTVTSLLTLSVGITGLWSIGMHGLILHIYIIIFSLATLLMEVGSKVAPKVKQLQKPLEFLEKNFPFLKSTFGRACVYLFTASITLAYAYENAYHAVTGLLALANAGARVHRAQEARAVDQR